MTIAATSRTFTITLPLHAAAVMEELAARDGRSVDEVLSDAMEAHYARRIEVEEWLRQTQEYAAGRNHGHTEEDVPRLIREVRAEMDAERAAR